MISWSKKSVYERYNVWSLPLPISLNNFTMETYIIPKSFFKKQISREYDLGRVFKLVQKFDWYKNPVIGVQEITKDTKISDYNNLAYIVDVEWDQVTLAKMIADTRLYYSY